MRFSSKILNLQMKFVLWFTYCLVKTVQTQTVPCGCDNGGSLRRALDICQIRTTIRSKINWN